MENKVYKPNDKSAVHKEFLIKLQLEYLTHKLRSQIYKDERYAKVAKDIAEKKKSKIQDLSIKFGLPTVFNGYNIKKFVKRYFWRQNGLPFLQYKDEEQRRVQGNYDCWYLLYRGTKVIYHGRIAEVIINNPSKEEALIKISEQEFLVKYSELQIKNDYLWI